MASFQAKTGWKRSRKRENKNYRSVPFNPTRNWTFQKNSNIIEKIKVYHYGFISSQNKVGKGGERGKIKIIGPFRSCTTRNRKFQKNCKKIKKIKKYHYGFLSSQNRFEKAEKERKYKLSVRSVPTRLEIEN